MYAVFALKMPTSTSKWVVIFLLYLVSSSIPLSFESVCIDGNSLIALDGVFSLDSSEVSFTEDPTPSAIVPKMMLVDMLMMA